MEKEKEELEVTESEKKEPLKPLFKHQVLVTCILIVIVVVTTIVASLSIFSKTKDGTEYNVIQVGELELSYVDLSDEGNVLHLTDQYPVSDTIGSQGTAYRFSVENTGKKEAKYLIRIVADKDTIAADGCRDHLLDPSYIRYQFDHQNPGNLEDVANLNRTRFTVYTGVLQPRESNIHEIRLWIGESSPNSVLGKHYHGKVEIKIEREGEPLEEEENLLSDKVFEESNLEENCKIYDDGVETFLVGQCPNNYVLYSEKMWRIVSKNNATGTIKIVTEREENSPSFSSTAFENSTVDIWLNQEFLKTLENYEEYLVLNGSWNIEENLNSSSSRPLTPSITRSVGLLNGYDYYTIDNPSVPINSDYKIYPAINLKSGLVIGTGDGSHENPYKLG